MLFSLSLSVFSFYLYLSFYNFPHPSNAVSTPKELLSLFTITTLAALRQPNIKASNQLALRSQDNHPIILSTFRHHRELAVAPCTPLTLQSCNLLSSSTCTNIYTRTNTPIHDHLKSSSSNVDLVQFLFPLVLPSKRQHRILCTLPLQGTGNGTIKHQSMAPFAGLRIQQQVSDRDKNSSEVFLQKSYRVY